MKGVPREESSRLGWGRFLRPLGGGSPKTARPAAARSKPWIAVCRRDSLVEGRGRAVVVGGSAIALFLSSGEVFAVSNQCPHREVPLDDGFIDEGCLHCPWHSWRFELTTGDHLTTFGRRPGLATFPVIVEDDTVWVDPRPSVRGPVIAAPVAGTPIENARLANESFL